MVTRKVFNQACSLVVLLGCAGFASAQDRTATMVEPNAVFDGALTSAGKATGAKTSGSGSLRETPRAAALVARSAIACGVQSE